MKKEIIILCGPTASGKSYLGHEFAKVYNGEIINIDSMQVYKEIPIITASPSEIHKAEIPYWLYNFLPITEDFSVIKYLKLAAEKINEINARGKLPILIGGTGLYINSLVFGYNDIPDISPNLRKQVRDLHSEIGNIELHSKLVKLDPLAASKIKSGDTQRLIRAYEVFMQTDKSILSFQATQKEIILPEYNFKIIFLNPERKFLYKICRERLQKIFKEGAIEEITLVKQQFNLRPFQKQGFREAFAGDTSLRTATYKSVCEDKGLGLTPRLPLEVKFPQGATENYLNLKAVGIKEILGYLEGKTSLDEAFEATLIRTRQYAKRQVTWFKHQINDKITLEYSNEDEFSQIARKLPILMDLPNSSKY